MRTHSGGIASIIGTAAFATVIIVVLNPSGILWGSIVFIFLIAWLLAFIGHAIFGHPLGIWWVFFASAPPDLDEHKAKEEPPKEDESKKRDTIERF